jgi:Uncharacterised ACR, YggU family COG1872
MTTLRTFDHSAAVRAKVPSRTAPQARFSLDQKNCESLALSNVQLHHEDLPVKVKPNERVSALEEGGNGLWLVQLKSPPVDGKANKELVTCLLDISDVPSRLYQ